MSAGMTDLNTSGNAVELTRSYEALVVIIPGEDLPHMSVEHIKDKELKTSAIRPPISEKVEEAA